MSPNVEITRAEYEIWAVREKPTALNGYGLKLRERIAQDIDAFVEAEVTRRLASRAAERERPSNCGLTECRGLPKCLKCIALDARSALAASPAPAVLPAEKKRTQALKDLLAIAAELAQRKPLISLSPLEDVTHIGHRQFAAAYMPADDAMGALAMRLRTCFDVLRPACPECKGAGYRDSGGSEPWGAPIMVKCGCQPAVLPRAAEIEPMRSALERLHWNFKLMLSGKPVRDVAETLAEVEAALAAAPVAQPSESIQQLMKFYAVDTVEALVDAQCKHVERLQEKLPKTPSLAPAFPRG